MLEAGNVINYLPGLPLSIMGPGYETDLVNLFVQGQGSSDSDGWFVNHNNMNLFINREFNSHAERLSLFINSPQDTNSLDFYISGTTVVFSSVPLFVMGSGIFYDDTTLYTHGF